jgi:hypothetical protein
MLGIDICRERSVIRLPDSRTEGSDETQGSQGPEQIRPNLADRPVAEARPPAGAAFEADHICRRLAGKRLLRKLDANGPHVSPPLLFKRGLCPSRAAIQNENAY